MKNFLLLLLFLSLGYVAVNYAVTQSKKGPEAEPVTIQGKILMGVDINKPYCAEGVYIVPDHALYPTLLLRTASAELWNDTEFAYNVVTLKGLYTREEVMCEAQICECEEYVTVSSLEERE